MANGRSNELTSFLQLLDSELMCGVCLELFENPVMLPCTHNFCRECISNVIEHGRSFSFFSLGPPTSFNCPICQMHIDRNTVDHLPTNKPLKNIIAIYQSCSPIDIFDMAWNRDLRINIGSCPEHKEEMNRYCESCSAAICKTCEAKHGQRHKVNVLRQVASVLQADIADTLTELKKKTLPVYERIERLDSMLKEMDTEEENTRKRLKHHIESLKSLLDAKQEELSLIIHTKVLEASIPVRDQLQRCKLYRTKVQEMMKKLASIRKTEDINQRIKLMKDSILQLNIMLQDDFEWCAENTIPECTRLNLNLDVLKISTDINILQWEEEVESEKRCTKSTQTDSVIEHTDLDGEIQERLNSVNLHTDNVFMTEDYQNNSGKGIIKSENTSKDEIQETRQIHVYKHEPSNVKKEANIVFEKEIDSLKTDMQKLDSLPKSDSHAGRRSLPFDSFTLKDSSSMEKTCLPNQNRTTGVNKFHTSQSDGSLALRNSTSEALAKFVARRRTLSPFASDSSRKRLSTSPLASSGDSSSVEKKEGAQESIRESMQAPETTSPLASSGDSSSVEKKEGAQESIRESMQAPEKDLSPKNFSKKPISIKLDFETDV